MNIEKLPSGSYRITQMEDGQRYRVTVPYKPSKKEAYQLIQDKITGADKLKKTFKECAREYIDSKKHVLSPSTIRGYESLYKVIQLPDKPIGSISAVEIQKYIDTLFAQGKSAKTVQNYHGFISAVFKAFAPQVILYTKLPRKAQEMHYTPSDEDIMRILSSAKGTPYEIPLRLGCYGLRRSEVCALTPDDLDGNVITINKALVQDDKKNWIVWRTKTESSERKVMIDEELADMIRKQGYVYKGYPNNIYWFLARQQDKLKIPHFPLHYLRHYYASTMHDLGVSDAAIMESGGWKTDHVMKRVYRHAKNISEQQKKMIEHYRNIRNA